jgi:hypothetical protein
MLSFNAPDEVDTFLKGDRGDVMFADETVPVASSKGLEL